MATTQDPNRPRLLTEAEIEDIASVIPPILSVDREIAATLRRSVINKVKDQLHGIEITPLAIDDLKKEIRYHYERSLVRSGEAVGVLAAQSFGQPITQMTLNSFHFSGASRNATVGFARIKELIYGTKNVKNKSVTIHFQNPNLTFEQVIQDKREEIVSVDVNRLLRDYTIDQPETFFEQGQPWWYQSFNSLIYGDQPIPESRFMLRLYLNVDRLYAYKIRMEDIAAGLEQGTQPSILAVYSPITEGIIDIYPIEETVIEPLEGTSNVAQEDASLIFLQTTVVPSLDKVHLKGIRDIRGLYPVETPTWQVIKEDVPDPTEPGVWYLKFNTVRMITSGITRERVVRLVEAAGLEVLPLPEQYANFFLRVRVPERFVDSEDQPMSPAQVVNGQIPDVAPGERRSPFEIYSKYTFAETEGGHLQDILMLDDIDATHTYSNDIHELIQVLGVEAVRNYLIRDILVVFANEGLSIDPRHVNLLADSMTNQGFITSITFKGIRGRDIGTLSLASHQKAMEVFREAAAFGRRDRVTGVSDSIFVGKRALVGTGIDTKHDWQIERQTQRMLERVRAEMATAQPSPTIQPTTRPTTAQPQLDVSSFRKGLSRARNLVFGDDIMAFQGQELEAMFNATVTPPQPSQPPSVSIGAQAAPPARTRPAVLAPDPQQAQPPITTATTTTPVAATTPTSRPTIIPPEVRQNPGPRTVSDITTQALRTATQAPCLPQQPTTTMSVRPHPGPSETVPLPTTATTTTQPAESGTSTLQLPRFGSAVGVNPNIQSLLQEAKQAARRSRPTIEE